MGRSVLLQLSRYTEDHTLQFSGQFFFCFSGKLAHIAHIHAGFFRDGHRQRFTCRIHHSHCLGFLPDISPAGRGLTVIDQAKVLCQFLRRFFWGEVKELFGKVDHIPIFTAAKAVESQVYLHAGVLIIVKRTAGHAISPDFYPIKLCRFSGADRLLDRFKYILCHVPLTAGLSHRRLVSGSFRTLTGSFATLGAVWLPD